MNKPWSVLLLAFFVLGYCCVALAEPNPGVLRSPGTFKQLPRAVVASLTKEGCRIPPAIDLKDLVSTNVISGEFAQKDQKDWAIFCFVNGHSYIRVFWGGPAQCASRIARHKEEINAAKIEEWGGIGIAIGPVGKKFIMEHYEAYGEKPPIKITHQGINYYFVGKASVVYYCHRGQWLVLPGAD